MKTSIWDKKRCLLVCLLVLLLPFFRAISGKNSFGTTMIEQNYFDDNVFDKNVFTDENFFGNKEFFPEKTKPASEEEEEEKIDFLKEKEDEEKVRISSAAQDYAGTWVPIGGDEENPLPLDTTGGAGLVLLVACLCYILKRWIYIKNNPEHKIDTK